MAHTNLQHTDRRNMVLQSIIISFVLSISLTVVDGAVDACNTPEFQSFPSLGCYARAAFEDPSNSNSIIVWCTPDTSISHPRNLSRIQIEDDSLQSMSLTTIWQETFTTTANDMALGRNDTFWIALSDSIIRLSRSNVSNDSSTSYGSLVVWNNIDATQHPFNLDLVLATNDLYFITTDFVGTTQKMWKLPNGVGPAIRLSIWDSYPFSSFQVHQPTEQVFAMSGSTVSQPSIWVYSPKTDIITTFAQFNLANSTSIQQFLPSPHASVVWISCFNLYAARSHLLQPLLISVQEHAVDANVLVTANDCVGQPAGGSISFDATSQILYLTCGDQLLGLWMDANYQILSKRLVTDSRCTQPSTPLQLAWSGRRLPIIIPCTGEGLFLATDGNSITSAVSPIDCATPTLVSSFPNSVGQTMLLLQCAGYPSVFIDGTTYPLTQLSPNHNGVAHLPNTDLVYSACIFADDAMREQIQLRVVNVRTQVVTILSDCPSSDAILNVNVPHYGPPADRSNLLSVNADAVVYSCGETIWKINSHIAHVTTVIPTMLINLTAITPAGLVGRPNLNKVQSMGNFTALLYYNSYGPHSLLIDDAHGSIHPFPDDGACSIIGFDLVLGGSALIYVSVNITHTAKQSLNLLNLINHQQTVLQEVSLAFLGYASDRSINGSHLTFFWSNSTTFLVFDHTSGTQIATHSFPDNCVDTIYPSNAYFKFIITQGSAVVALGCNSFTAPTSLWVSSLTDLLNQTIIQPFSPLLPRHPFICYPITSLFAGAVDHELLYIGCDTIIGFTSNFRCFPGQTVSSEQIHSIHCTIEGGSLDPVSNVVLQASNLKPVLTQASPRWINVSVVLPVEQQSQLAPLRVQYVCPLGSYTPALGSSCALCNGTNQVGLNCANGFAMVQEGYFAYLVTSDEPVPIFETAICLRGLCPGGPLQLATLNGETVDGTIQYCAEPRFNSPSNLLCGACDSMLGYIEWGTSCVRCSGVDVGMVFALIAFSVVVVGWLQVSSASRRSTTSGHVALLLYFLQTALIQLDPLPEWIRFMHMVNFSTGSVGRCVAPITPMQQTALELSIPLILLGVLACFALVQFVCHYCTAGSSHHFPRVTSAALNRFASPLVSNAAGGGDEFNNYEDEISFADSSPQNGASPLSFGSSFATRWGPLYRGYNPSSARYWTSIVLLRRSVLAVVSIYMANPQQFAYRQVSFVLIHFASYQLHIRAQPYATHALNVADGVSHSILLILGCLQVMVGGNSQPSVWMQIVVVSMVMIPTLIMIVWIAMVQWSSRRSTLKSRPFDPSGSVDETEADSPSPSFLSRSWYRFRTSFELNRYVAGAVSILLFTYTGVVQTAFAFLRCVPVGSASIVFSAPTIDCHSQAYQHASVAVILVLIVFGFGFPIASLVLLTRNRVHISGSDHSDAARGSNDSNL